MLICILRKDKVLILEQEEKVCSRDVGYRQIRQLHSWKYQDQEKVFCTQTLTYDSTNLECERKYFTPKM